MKTSILCTALIGFVVGTAPAMAQAPAGQRPPPPPPSLIDYGQAATAMAAAEAYARDHGWNMSIRIVDQNGYVVMVHKLDNANPRTADVAARKTLTVIASKMTSAEYGAKVKAGEIEEIENAVTFGGGVPIYLDGKLIGAIAASGARPEEDEAVAKAGVEAIGGTISMH